MSYPLDEPTDTAAFGKPTLRDAARRFGVQRWSQMIKADLVEALDYTAWTPAAETVHSYLWAYRPDHGQPKDTCGICYRPHHIHCSPRPGRFGWPYEWAWKYGEPFPE